MFPVGEESQTETSKYNTTVVTSPQKLGKFPNSQTEFTSGIPSFV